MLDVSKIALLKLIREHEPISILEIAQIIRNDHKLNSVDAYNHLLENIESYPSHAVEDLLALGLIKSSNNTDFDKANFRNTRFDPNIKLTTGFDLPRLQKLLKFSLTSLIEAGENPLLVNPFFRHPRSNKANTNIFVAMPFREDLEGIYKNHILKVTEELNISCKRGDDFFTANRIMDDIWSAIYHSKLCIVDCTGRNANVFYELGIAHTLGRKTILIAQSQEDIPFDVKDLRTIIYTNKTPEDLDKFEAKLKRTIQEEFHKSSF